jgi:16S rRNA (adenine1518-N6/adenine1519-N6)-dimethyltransferase
MPRQTISYLTRRFQEVGLEPDSRHGQNFLIDLNLVQLLVRSAEIGPDDVVLEVGTGTGSLTAMMAEQAAAVVTVEIDAHLYQMASEALAKYDNITMLQFDALKNKNQIAPQVIETVKEKLSEGEGRRFKLAANLPYNIATPLISNLLLTEIVPDTMTVTIQKELADRITARPSTKDYSALSIWVQSVCDAEIVRIMPPSVFWPRPKVQSAIIHLAHSPEKRARITDVEFFHAFVRSMFFHRRKFLRSVVISAFKGRLDKAAVDGVLEQMQLGPDARAEQLDVPTMVALCDLLRQKVNESAASS